MPFPKWPPPLKPVKNRPNHFRVYHQGRAHHITGESIDHPLVKQAYARLIAELAAGVHDRKETITVAEMSLRFIKEWAEKRYCLDEVEEYTRVVKDLNSLYADFEAPEFGLDELEALRGVWLGRGNSRPVINRRAGRVIYVFGWAARKRLLSPTVPAVLRELLPLERGEAHDPPDVKPVPLDLVEATIPSLPPVPRMMVRFQLATAARPGELKSLTLGQLRHAKRTVVAGVELLLVELVEHKNAWRGQDRVIVVTPSAIAAVEDLIGPDRGDDEYLFSPDWQKAKLKEERRAKRKSKVTPSQVDRSKEDPIRKPGKRYSRSSYAEAIRRACEVAGVAHWHPHQLRHTAGDEIERKYGYEIARVILGHKSIDATKIYAAGSMDRALLAMAEMEQKRPEAG